MNWRMWWSVVEILCAGYDMAGVHMDSQQLLKTCTSSSEPSERHVHQASLLIGELITAEREKTVLL